MRVVHFVAFFDESLEYQENFVARVMVELGHDVTVATSTLRSAFHLTSPTYRPSSSPASYSMNGIRIERLAPAINLRNRLMYLRGLAPLLRELKPDLVFAHNVTPNLVDCVSYIRSNPTARLVLDCHSDFGNSARSPISRYVLHGMLYRSLLSYALPYASKVFAITPGTATFMRTLYGMNSRNIELLPLGGALHPLGSAQEAKNKRVAARAKLGHRLGSHVVFTGGKLVPEKRTDVLLRAVALLPDLDLKVVIAGSGTEDHGSYVSQLHALGKSIGRTEFTGWLDEGEMTTQLHAADIAVFPASQSILWQKAIALGLPLIVGGSRNLDVSYLNQHDNVVIVPDDELDERRLADELRGTLGDSERLAEMREGARRMANEVLNWQLLVKKVLPCGETLTSPPEASQTEISANGGSSEVERCARSSGEPRPRE